MTNKLLVIGDFNLNSGFSTVTESLLPFFQKQFEVVRGFGVGLSKVSECNGCVVHPADPHLHDFYGFGLLAKILKKYKPTHIWINNDIQVCYKYAQIIRTCSTAQVSFYVPVDGHILNFKPYVQCLNEGNLIFYTEYGKKQVLGHVTSNLSSYTNKLLVAGHSVDESCYHPKNKPESRRELAWLSEDDFVISWVNTNTPRKDIYSAISAFQKVGERLGYPKDLKLVIRASISDTNGDFSKVVNHPFLYDSVVVVEPKQIKAARGLLSKIYSSSDLFLSTSLGEGWGLCEQEALASGVPCVLPNNSVRQELYGDSRGVFLYESQPYYSPQFSNVMGMGVQKSLVMQLCELYENQDLNYYYSSEAYETFSSMPKWADIAEIHLNQFKL